jgi:hypothetical protein
MTSFDVTMDETETLPSLMPSAAMCEWQSMMPGITNCPPASMILASGGMHHLFAHFRDFSVANQDRSVQSAFGHGQNGCVLNHDGRRGSQPGRRAYKNHKCELH